MKREQPSIWKINVHSQMVGGMKLKFLFAHLSNVCLVISVFVFNLKRSLRTQSMGPYQY